MVEVYCPGRRSTSEGTLLGEDKTVPTGVERHQYKKRGKQRRLRTGGIGKTPNTLSCRANNGRIDSYGGCPSHEKWSKNK